MPNGKLLEVITYLNNKQRRKLLQFAQSPYFNNRSNADQLIELLQLILHYINSPGNKALQKENLQAQFFPESPYSAKTKNEIDALASRLNKLVERFIVYEELEDEIEKRTDYGLARFFERMGNTTRFWAVLRKFRKDWDKEPRHDSNDYLLRSQIEALAVGFAGSYDPNSKLISLQDVDTFLDKGFFTKKLELAIILSYSSLYQHSADTFANQFSEYVEKTYPKYQSTQTVIADIYYLALQVFHHPKDEKLFQSFEQLIHSKEAYIPEKEINNVQTFYRYFYGRHYKLSGNTGLSAKLVALYKDHLKRGYFFFNDDKMFVSTLKLLVNFGLKQKELAWVEQLLEQVPVSKIMGTKYPEEIHSLCLAELHFVKGDYQEAEKLIIYRLFEDVNYSLSCDILLIKIYFATENDLLESRIRAMELKVRRAGVREFDKKSYLNFISITRQVSKYKWFKDNEKLEELSERISSGIPLIQREWLQRIIA